MSKDIEYNIIRGDYSDLPQWAQNRLNYQSNKNLIESLIKENENWIEYHKKFNDIINVVRHRDRVLGLKNQLLSLDRGREIPL